MAAFKGMISGHLLQESTTMQQARPKKGPTKSMCTRCYEYLGYFHADAPVVPPAADFISATLSASVSLPKRLFEMQIPQTGYLSVELLDRQGWTALV